MDSRELKNQQSGNASEASSSQPRLDALNEAAGPSRSHARQQVEHEGHPIDNRTGHKFDNASASGSARAHYGDVNVGVYNAYLHSAGQKATEEEQLIEEKTREDDLKQEQWKLFMKALIFEQMDDRLASISPARKKTCRWIFESTQFRRWSDPSLHRADNRLLWIKGKAGTGKSTMMRSIWEHVHQKMQDHIAICFFFNARGGALQKSVEGMYRTLLYLLHERLPRLREAVDLPPSFQKHHTFELPILRQILRESVLSIHQERLICLVDALDEGDQHDDVRGMVEFLEDLTETARDRGISFQSCFASRHYPAITARACEEVIVEEQVEHNRDIDTYIDQTLGIREKAFREELRRELTRKSKGVFLWVVLVVRKLNQMYDQGALHGELRASLGTVPGSLYDLLRGIMEGGAPDKYLLPSLVWVFVAKRALTIHELYSAIRLSTTQENTINRARDCVDWDYMRRFILNASKGLIEFISNGTEDETHPSADRGSQLSSPRSPRRLVRDVSDDRASETTSLAANPLDQYGELSNQGHTVQFVHESVREYILRGGLSNLCSNLNKNVEARCHAMVSDYCQNFARLPLPVRLHMGSRVSVDTLTFSEGQVQAFWASDLFLLLPYIAAHAFDHFESACLGGAIGVDSLEDFPLDRWITLNNLPSPTELSPQVELDATLPSLLMDHHKNLAEAFVEHEASCRLHRARMLAARRVRARLKAGLEAVLKYFFHRRSTVVGMVLAIAMVMMCLPAWRGST